MGGDPAAERKTGNFRGVGNVFYPNTPSDRLAIVARHRHVEHHTSITGQHVAFPRQPRDCVASPHEEAIPRVLQDDRRVAVRRVIVELQSALMTAVAVVVEYATVAALHL